MKSALTAQIRTKNIKLANFLYNRKMFDVNSSTCLCEHQRQTMKHIIVSCSQDNRNEIENERNSMNYLNFINTTTEFKKLTQ